jgi:hypothetical protein
MTWLEVRNASTTCLLAVLAGCYQQPSAEPADTDMGSGTEPTGNDPSAPSASGGPQDSTGADDPTTTSPPPPDDSTGSEPSTTDPTGDDTTTGPGVACGDGQAVAGELCLDGKPELLPVDRNPWDVDVGDVDLDGALDLVTINQISNDQGTVSIVQSDGIGGFAAPENVGVPRFGFRVRVADGDADGDADIVAAGDGIAVLTNVGGSFWSAATVPNWFGGSYEIGELHVVDLDGDGVLDLIASEAYGYATVTGVVDNERWEFPGGASGGFPVPGEGASGIIATDFDFASDGFVDGVGLNQYGSLAPIVIGNGDGTFDDYGASVGVCPAKFTGGRHGVAGDIDANGTTDLVVTCMEGDFTIIRGVGDGTFAPPEIYPLDGAFRPYLVDLELDGDLDLFITSVTLEQAVLYLNDGAGGFEMSPLVFGSIGAAHGMAIHDIDGDGALDVLLPYDDGASGIVALWRATP